MTARDQSHKYRCETCNNPDCPVWLPDNAKLAQRGKMRGDHHILTILSKCGCASHSDAIKADPIELYNRIEKQSPDTPMHAGWVLLSVVHKEIMALPPPSKAEQRIADAIPQINAIRGLYEKGLIDKQVERSLALLRGKEE